MTDPNHDADYHRWPSDSPRNQHGKITHAHQKVALDKLHAWYTNLPSPPSLPGGGILALPTGSGKTFTAIQFLSQAPLSDGYRILWLAHTHHLLDQAFRSFKAEGPSHVRVPRSVRMRLVSGQHFPPRCVEIEDDVLFMTLQTAVGAFQAEEAHFMRWLATSKKVFIVFDEAHHAPAPSYRRLLMALKARGAHILGLTATPTHGDENKKGWLAKIFPQGILSEAGIPELIAQGVLAQPNWRECPTDIKVKLTDKDYQRWHRTFRDLPEDIVTRLAQNAPRNNAIAKHYHENHETFQKTLIFTDRWYQCEAIGEALRKLGYRTGSVYSKVDANAYFQEQGVTRKPSENERVLHAFKNNELDVLLNVRMLTEGTDLPGVQTVFLTRKTTSEILLKQMVGRAMRGKAFGGTEKAHIVCFVDDWVQKIDWAMYRDLPRGPTDEGSRPLHRAAQRSTVPVEVIQQLARQLDEGHDNPSQTAVSIIPAGWYQVTFDATVALSPTLSSTGDPAEVAEGPTDEVERIDRLVLVMDDEVEAFDRFIAAMLVDLPEAFSEVSVPLAVQRPYLEQSRRQYFGASRRSVRDLEDALLTLAMHIGQSQAAPPYHSFAAGRDHDLDALATNLIAQDLGPVAMDRALRAEYARHDRFWPTLLTSFEIFRQQYQARQNRCLETVLPTIAAMLPPQTIDHGYVPQPVDDDLRAHVKRRDGEQCLACGSKRRLEIDHKQSVYHGGQNTFQNLQLLCRTCNKKKDRLLIDFTHHSTQLGASPTKIPSFDPPPPEDAANPEAWARYLRQTLNFTFQCSAVADVSIGRRGDGYHNWTVILYPGNPALWLKPQMNALVNSIQDVRRAGGKPDLHSFTIHEPEGEELTWSR